MDTIYLITDTWDMAVDVDGNIALANNPYALAQDAASQIKTWQGEVWYDTTQGIPYNSQILGQLPTLSFMKACFTKAALAVPEVTASKAYITSFTDRQIKGQVQITDASGNLVALGF